MYCKNVENWHIQNILSLVSSQKFELLEDAHGNVHREKIVGIEPANQDGLHRANVTVESNGKHTQLQVRLRVQRSAHP